MDEITVVMTRDQVMFLVDLLGEEILPWGDTKMVNKTNGFGEYLQKLRQQLQAQLI